MKVKEQIHTNQYSIYNGDCMDVIHELDNESIDLCIYSPPFANLYTYSSSERDMSNVSSNEEFLEQFEYLVKELSRVTKSGRINALHVTDFGDIAGTLKDFPSEIIKLYQKHGFEFKNRITIWKEPLKVRIKTMVQSLMHKYIVEDSTKCFPANPDYILLFKKKGDNEVPVVHPYGLQNYAGSRPILEEMLTVWNNYKENPKFKSTSELWEHLEGQKGEEKITKRNYYIWQRYASGVWDDIRGGNCLNYKDSKEEDDEKHVTPTQLDVLDRLVDLYSNPDEVVLSPFMGVGSDVFSPVSMGRKAIGIELKDSYFKQAILNMKEAERRFVDNTQLNLL
jgi:DNA modification methylase